MLKVCTFIHFEASWSSPSLSADDVITPSTNQEPPFQGHVTLRLEGELKVIDPRHQPRHCGATMSGKGWGWADLCKDSM